MTDGQWLWIMIHMSVDNDEQFEKMCNKCKVKSEENRCITCGEKSISEYSSNPNFDEKLFEELKSKAE